jgi:hypothetical protein
MVSTYGDNYIVIDNLDHMERTLNSLYYLAWIEHGVP